MHFPLFSCKPIGGDLLVRRLIREGAGGDGPPPKREVEGTELLISPPPIFCKHKHVDSFLIVTLRAS